MSVGAHMVVVLKAFVEHSVSLVLGHPFEFSWLDVSQTDVFHRRSPLVGGRRRNLARWLVLPIVAGHKVNRQPSQLFSIATPSAALRGTDALARTEPGPGPSHTNRAPRRAFPPCGPSPPGRRARDGSQRVPRGPARRR